MLTFDSKFYLQIKGTAMGTIFAPTYANVTMGYHEIKVYSIIHQSYALSSKYSENFWFRYLDNCQVLLKVNLIKPEHLLSKLTQINNNIQFTMGKTSSKTTFFNYYKQKRYKDLNGYLQQTNRLKTICHIYVKTPTAFFNRYTIRIHAIVKKKM